jgi:YfiH family protein
MNRVLLRVARFQEIPGLVHGFGTRRFGLADLRRLAARRGAAVVLLDQVHSRIVRLVRTAPAEGRTGDGLATRSRGLILAVKTADCLPILLADGQGRAVAAVHAGWRGTALGVAGRAVAVLRGRFGLNPAGFWAALGPSIGPSCYEVGADVRRRFAGTASGEKFFHPKRGRPEKFLFDLAASNAAQLEAAGVPRARILRVGGCTHCRPDLHSWRRDGDSRRRLYSFIGLV